MGSPGKLCEALTWWDQGRLCCAHPTPSRPEDEALCGATCGEWPASCAPGCPAQCGVTALATRALGLLLPVCWGRRMPRVRTMDPKGLWADRWGQVRLSGLVLTRWPQR